MAYFAMIVVLALTTPYLSEHPATLGLFGGLTLFSGVARTISARRLAALPLNHVPARKRTFICTLYASFLIWGLFSGVTVLLYPNQWTSMYVLLLTASIAAAASSWLAPEEALAYHCLVVLIVPTTVCAATEIDRQHLAVAIATLFYLGFLVVQARE